MNIVRLDPSSWLVHHRNSASTRSSRASRSRAHAAAKRSGVRRGPALRPCARTLHPEQPRGRRWKKTRARSAASGPAGRRGAGGGPSPLRRRGSQHLHQQGGGGRRAGNIEQRPGRGTRLPAARTKQPPSPSGSTHRQRRCGSTRATRPARHAIPSSLPGRRPSMRWSAHRPVHGCSAGTTSRAPTGPFPCSSRRNTTLPILFHRRSRSVASSSRQWPDSSTGTLVGTTTSSAHALGHPAEDAVGQLADAVNAS